MANQSIATWSSRNGRWTAELTKGEFGYYHLRERKDGTIYCGASQRLNDDEIAIDWAKWHVSTSDVSMFRC